MCPFAQRVNITLRELGIPFQEVNVDLKNKPSSFLKLNPEGKIPVLVHGDKVLIESLLIVEYLIGVFPKPR